MYKTAIKLSIVNFKNYQIKGFNFSSRLIWWLECKSALGKNPKVCQRGPKCSEFFLLSQFFVNSQNSSSTLTHKKCILPGRTSLHMLYTLSLTFRHQSKLDLHIYLAKINLPPISTSLIMHTLLHLGWELGHSFSFKTS